MERRANTETTLGGAIRRDESRSTEGDEMIRPKNSRPNRTGGAILGPDLLVPVPMDTLSDEYRDEPVEPEDSSREPEPEAPGLASRLVHRVERALGR